jgi:uncharacterized protein involved in outer membrane biogenesis
LTAVLMVLIVAGYFVVTSSAFLKGVILSRVGSALNAAVTVSDAEVHPFSAIILRDLKVQATGQPPLITASEVRVSYHLFDILGGNFHVDEITLAAPTFELVENADGSSNLGQMLKTSPSQPSAEKKPAPSGPVSKPLRIDLGKLTLSNANILKIKNYADGHRDLAALTNVNVTLTNLKNGQAAKLALSANIRIENNAPGSNGVLTASFEGNLNGSFNPDMKLDSADGGVNFTVSQADGMYAGFDTFGAVLDCDITPAEIKKLTLHFQKAGIALGEVSVAGPFDAEKMEGKLAVELRGIDQRLLNLAGAKSGLDFGTSRIDSTNEIELAKAGATITATGSFNAGKVQLTRAGQTTPTLDLSAAYDVTVDRTAQVATLRSLNLNGTQNNAPLLSAQLASPMSLAWGGGTGGMGDAAFDLAVTSLNLADWRPFLGDLASAGNVGLKLKVSSHQGGKQIGFDLTTDAANLTVQLGSNQISQVGITLDAHGQVVGFKQITLSNYTVQVALQDLPALAASGSGNYDLGTGDADTQVKLQAALARLLQALPQPGLKVSSGDVELNARVTQKQQTQTLAGDLALTHFNGQSGANEFLGYSSQLKLDVASSPAQIQINRLAGSFSQNGNSGGDFELTGTVKPAQQSAAVSVKFSGLNENALRPFMEPLLAGKKLASVSVNGMVSGQYDPRAGSAVKADLQVTNLIVNDSRQQFPAPPLAASLQVDATLDQQAADVRQFQITLTPTALAANQLQFSGQVNFSKTNAIQGNLKLAADSLDLTSYYDLFTGGTNAATATATNVAAASSSANAGQEEPAAFNLPLRNFTLAAEIRQLYLHEMVVSNFETTVKADGGHLVLKPFQLMLNGAPVAATADVDLGVPGYKYNVTFNAQGVPVAPLVDTFEPSRAGQMGGTVTADAQISGAGFTGANLQKNLAGTFNLDLTDLNLSVDNVHSHILKSVVSVIAVIPELLSNPVNAIASLIGGVTGRGGLMHELDQSPIEVISVQATAGGGQVDLRSATVQSAAFEADGAGVMTLNSVLTNSVINLPITVLLSQAVAKQLNVTSTAATANAAYIPLPQFLKLTGTIGNPKSNINKLALAGAAIKSVGGDTAAPVVDLLNQFLHPH